MANKPGGLKPPGGSKPRNVRRGDTSGGDGIKGEAKKWSGNFMDQLTGSQGPTDSELTRLGGGAGGGQQAQQSGPSAQQRRQAEEQRIKQLRGEIMRLKNKAEGSWRKPHENIKRKEAERKRRMEEEDEQKKQLEERKKGLSGLNPFKGLLSKADEVLDVVRSRKKAERKASKSRG